MARVIRLSTAVIAILVLAAVAHGLPTGSGSAETVTTTTTTTTTTLASTEPETKDDTLAQPQVDVASTPVIVAPETDGPVAPAMATGPATDREPVDANTPESVPLSKCEERSRASMEAVCNRCLLKPEYQKMQESIHDGMPNLEDQQAVHAEAAKMEAVLYLLKCFASDDYPGCVPRKYFGALDHIVKELPECKDDDAAPFMASFLEAGNSLEDPHGELGEAGTAFLELQDPAPEWWLSCFCPSLASFLEMPEEGGPAEQALLEVDTSVQKSEETGVSGHTNMLTDAEGEEAEQALLEVDTSVQWTCW